MDENIVMHNVTLMVSDKPGHMRSLADESMGGNAQRHDGHPCQAFNFFYDMQTGRIFYFGLPQDAPQRIREEYSLGRFRMVVAARAWVKEKIVEIDTPQITPYARENLEESVKRYNASRGTPNET